MSADDLLLAVMSAAARFSETGHALYLDFSPDVRRWEPIARLVGTVRIGMAFLLPDGREMSFDVSLRPTAGGRWAVGGGVTLDESEHAEVPLDFRMDEAETEEPAALLGEYTEQLAERSRWLLGEALSRSR